MRGVAGLVRATTTEGSAHRAVRGPLLTLFASAASLALLGAMGGLNRIPTLPIKLGSTSARGRTQKRNLCTCTKNFGPY